MDFTKAILNVHFVDVERVTKEINAKLNDTEWRKANNRYLRGNATGQSSTVEAYYFDYEIDNAIIIFAEIKKRLEIQKWRVLVLHHGTKNLAKLQLYR